MAELFMSPVLQVVLDKLSTPGVQMMENILGVGVADNIKKLRKTLDMVQFVIEDAEEQLASDAAARIWLSSLKDFAYDALYLLLDIDTYPPLASDKLYFPFFGMTNAEKIRFVLSELERVVDKLLLELNTGAYRLPVYKSWARRETSYPVKESEVHGRKQDKENLVNLLLLSDSFEVAANHSIQDGGDVPCVIIEGMTAIGKTTLAQLAFNDQKITQHFDVKVWVSVSHHFDPKKILTAVVESVTNDSCSLSNLPALHLAVERLLKDKRYFIVLDDVWTDKKDDWDRLRPLLGGTSAKYGSRILITTQNKRLAVAMNVSPHLRYSLRGLTEDHCWGLFKQLAFEPGDEEEYPTLWLIGQEIVRKCGGVALAAKSLGSLLRLKRDEREWSYIRDHELWNLDEEAESGILPALRLSYSRLPRHLRRCFAFCSIFPQGYSINKEKLIHLWMAEGLIFDDDKDSKRAEDTGRSYFNDLLWMSYFEEEKQSGSGVVIEYKMHDVIYYLARSIAKSEYAILKRDFFSAPRKFVKIRHSSVVCNFNSPTVPDELYEAKGLLTFFLFSEGNFHVDLGKLFSTFQYLFALDLSGSGVTVLEGKSLSRLVHLKFLDLSYTLIRELPREIGDLSHLQSLYLSHCRNLVRLQLTWMRRLKYLNNSGCEALTTMCQERMETDFNPRGDYKIERLSLFVVEKSVDIKLLANFRLWGSLKITRLENVCDANHVREAKLNRMQNLRSLGLFWRDDDHRSSINQDEESVVTKFKERKQTHSPGSSSQQAGPPPDPLVVKDIFCNLVLPEALQRLVITGYPGVEFPSCGFPIFLNVIHLIGFKNIQHLPVLGHLQHLSSLLLQEMHALRSIEWEFYGKTFLWAPFNSLKELTLIDFPNLEEWSSVGVSSTRLGSNVSVAFPNLTKLILSGCPQLIEIPVQLENIKHLELRHCKATLVHSFRGLTSLETLVIEGVNDLFDFPSPFPGNNLHLSSLEIKSCSQLSKLPEEMENLTSLKSLTIRWCEDLFYLPVGLHKLTSLESLEISDCTSLECLPSIGTEGFRNLQTLSIENCNNLKSLPIGLQYLTSLVHLNIMFCSKLSALPQGVEHLSSLRSLIIIACDNLSSLPEGLQNLNTLHSLEIGNCPGIQGLPEWVEKLVSLRSLTISGCENITSLPEGIKCLTALQHLSIHDSPQLLESCRREGGEDWPKIVRVPHKHIGQPEQRHQSEAGSSSSSA